MLRADNFLQAYGRLPDDKGREYLEKTVTFEDALVSSPLFREHRLCLHRQLIYFITPTCMEIKYLIVKDQVPILKLELTASRIMDGDQLIDGNWYAPGTVYEPPELMVYTEKKSLQDQVNDVTARLEPLLSSHDLPYRRRDPHVPVPQEYREAMARLCMIRKQTDRVWAPTLYGDSLGLIDGYMITDQGGPRHTFFVPSERMAELDRALAWPSTCQEDKSQAVMPLKQRLEKARHGLPGSNASAVDPVRAFGAIRLEDYLTPFPEYAERLRRRFGELATFQEAADRVYQACLEAGLSRTAIKDCIKLMEDLMIPILDTCSPKRIYTRALDVRIKPAQKSPDPHASSAAAPMAALMRLPFPTLLMGAAIAAGQPCLLRNTQFILDDVLEGEAGKLQTTCWTLANYPFRMHLLDRSALNPEKQKNFAMLFHLFIQPFALLHRAAAPALKGPSEPVHSL